MKTMLYFDLGQFEQWLNVSQLPHGLALTPHRIDEHQSESINFKFGIKEQFKGNLVFKTPTQLKVERIALKFQAKNVQLNEQSEAPKVKH